MTKTRKTILNCVGTINTPTGDIIEPEYPEYRITLEELIDDDAEQESSVEYFMEDFTFIKSFRGNGIMLNEKLTYVEIATVVFLCDFICYTDCVLRRNGNKKGSPLTVRELSDLMGVKYDTFRKTMTSLKSKQVIGIHNTGSVDGKNDIKWITVNPYIFFRGQKVERWVRDFYSETEWAKIVRPKKRDTK